MPVFFITRTYKNLHRLRQIINVLIKHGFGHLVERLNLHPFVPFKRRVRGVRGAVEAPVGLGERIRLALEELGPAFVKFGQLLSTRLDILPEDLAEELRKLQDAVKPAPFEEIKRTLEAEFGVPAEKIFAEISPQAKASASIAQVHGARLHTGEQVVVKVQREGVQELLRIDTQVMRDLVPVVERYVPAARVYNLGDLVDEFARWIDEELDFTTEARHAQRFYDNFGDYPHVVIPRVFWEYTTKRVVVFEEIEGVKIDDFAILEEKGWDRKNIARITVEAFLKQVFEDNFFHGDPHAGNIFVIEEDKIALVDFGIVGRLDNVLARSVANMLIGLATRDVEVLMDEYEAMGASPEDTDIQAFRSDLSRIIDKYWGVPLKYIRAEQFLTDLARLAGRYRVRMPKDFLLLGKTLFVIGGLARELDPEMDFLEIVKPYAERIMKERFSIKREAIYAAHVLADALNFLRRAPKHAERVLYKLRRGELKIEFEHRGLDEPIREIDRASNRLAFALIIAALILSSSMILVAGKGPTLFGYPVIGIVGYLLAGVLGLWLVWGIMRSGRL